MRASQLPELLTAEQASQMLGLSGVIVRKYFRQGRLDGQRLCNGMWVTTAQDVSNFSRVERPLGRPTKLTVKA